MRTRILSLLLVLALLAGMLPAAVSAADEPVSVKVDITSQYSGGFLHAPQFGAEVSSDLAERYGYTDKIADGVSALDVLVKAHELVFGEDFTPETAEFYLTTDDNTVTMQFGVEPQGGGYFSTDTAAFCINGIFPSDGDEKTVGSGATAEYPGLTITQAQVRDGDLVEFMFGENPYTADMYDWFLDAEGNYQRNFNANVGEDLVIFLRGTYLTNMLRHKTFDELVETYSENGRLISNCEEIQIYTVDLASGSTTPIEDAVTDEDGEVTLNFDQAGTYTIAAYDDGEYSMANHIMTLTTVTVNSKPVISNESNKTKTGTAEVGVEYSFTINMFSDPDKDNLTYEVSVDDGPYTAADRAYKYVPEKEGTVVLKFRAYDGKAYSDDVCTLTLTVVSNLTPITVPNDVTLFVGKKTAHYVPFTPMEAVKTEEEAGTTTYYYELTNNTDYNYRISGDDYITYAGIFKKTAGYELTVTADDLRTEGKTKTTVDRDVSSNKGYNVADVYLNINEQGYLKLNAVGETYQIVNLRNWEATNSITANYFIEPDYHYTVIDETGAPSDNVITVSESGLVSAVGTGTAIVLVTYDAINVTSAAGGPFFGAIWPENTGVFVVSVGAGESGFKPNMTINEQKNPTENKLAGDALDAEHDVIYFTGERGEYTFIPDNGCSVFVANPTVADSMSFSGFVSVSANADGSVTVPLTHGRNIVKITKDGKAEYQLITAKQITVTVNNGEAVHPGDPISIVFDTLYHPANKLAGVYNMSAAIVYENVSAYEGKRVGGVGNQYMFASTAAAQTIDSEIVKNSTAFGVSFKKGDALTVPEDYNKKTFVLSGGVIETVGMGDPYGSHRNITLETGRAPNFTASMRDAYLGILPDIEIPIVIEGEENITVKFTLLGDSDHGSGGDVHTLRGGNLTTWLEQTEVSVEEGSTVIDLVTRALDEAGISYENPTGSYIESITFGGTTLAEFTNGALSGWMYTINGEHSDLSVSEQLLQDGDEIVFHYTDDYTAESGIGGSDKDQTVNVTDPENGSVEVSDKRAKTDDVVTVTPKPDKGYVTESVTVTGKDGQTLDVKDNGDGTYSFVMPAALPVTVTVTFRQSDDTCPSEKFTDVDPDAWYHKAVDYAVAHGLMNGTSTTAFAPNGTTTRAMIVTILYRLEGSPDANPSGFTDVASGKWYAKAIAWAAEHDIVNGYGNGKFGPGNTITREQMATILYRYASYKGYDVSAQADLSGYTDADSVSRWALTALRWANAAGVIEGTSKTKLSPDSSATRAQAATVLMRYCETIVK